MIFYTASGHEILADDADCLLLCRYSWYANKTSSGRLYAHARIPWTDERISMHRLLMEPPPELIVHHKNNNGLDNRRCNLQVTTNLINIRYAHMTADSVHEQDGRWRAQPRDETGTRISLGGYETREKAWAAVQNWKYRKMLELDNRSDQESRDLAALLWEELQQKECAAH